MNNNAHLQYCFTYPTIEGFNSRADKSCFFSLASTNQIEDLGRFFFCDTGNVKFSHSCKQSMFTNRRKTLLTVTPFLYIQKIENFKPYFDFAKLLLQPIGPRSINEKKTWSKKGEGGASFSLARCLFVFSVTATPIKFL